MLRLIYYLPARDSVVKSVRLVVGRLWFDSLAESDQKILKIGIHSFPA